MLKYCFLAFFTLACLNVSYAQPAKQFTVAVTNQAAAYPFNKFIGFIKEPVHPGLEFGYSKVTGEHKKHDLFYDIRAAYFYHRFVQYGIPVYFNYGYRYKFSKSFSTDARFGAGYFHSIAATDVLKQNDEGNYKNDKGVGRPQLMAALTLGVNYKIKLSSTQNGMIFFQYQQRLQTPFIKSYVPILPYNQIALGAAFSTSLIKKAKH